MLFTICCSSSEETTNLLLNDIWALESIEGEYYKADSTVEQQPMIEIHLKDERLHGNTGCNQLDGKVNVDGSQIKFLDMITTEIYCPGSIEQEFLRALGKVSNYKIEKMRLFLYEDETEKLVFKKID
jgi:heat shock protein HslJ